MELERSVERVGLVDLEDDFESKRGPSSVAKVPCIGLSLTAKIQDWLGNRMSYREACRDPLSRGQRSGCLDVQHIDLPACRACPCMHLDQCIDEQCFGVRRVRAESSVSEERISWEIRDENPKSSVNGVIF